MRRTILLVVVVLLAALVTTVPVARAEPPQLNTEAAMIGLAFPSDDPCITYDARVDVLRFVLPSDPSLLILSVGAYDSCAGQWLHLISGLSMPYEIEKSAFVVAPGFGGADLAVTVQGFDSVDQTLAPTTFDLHWSSLGHLPDGLAAVTGTITRGSMIVELDDSIVWNRWGADSFPWAGLWLCRFGSPNGRPGCLGQA